MKDSMYQGSRVHSCMDRREFLGNCAACAGAMAGLSLFRAGLAGAVNTENLSSEKARVKLIFTHRPPEESTWPRMGYDYEGRKKELTAKLRKTCPGVEFSPATAQTRLEAKALLKDDKYVDGYVVYMLGIFTGWPMNGPETIAAWGKPTVFIDDLYGGSGEFLIANAAVRRKGYNVTAVSSSDFNDVVEAVRCFECIKKLKCSTILEVGGGPAYFMHISSKLVREKFGTKVIDIDYDALDAAYRKADPAQARMWADRWIKEADKVIEPSKEEIVKSAAMYLGMCELMREHNAQAVTVNCLGGFREQKIKAYPCLGFFQLDNDGLVGACEGDTCSTLTKLIMTYLVGRPGFISDPVIDTSKNQVIYAHCVGMNKVFGPAGAANPYHIRSHAEDNKGAAVRSLMPLGEMTTTIKFDPRKDQVIFHQGKTVANIDEDKACRTKLAVEVKGDIDKLMNYWDQWHWHRVTFFGDHKKKIKHFAELLGIELVEEA